MQTDVDKNKLWYKNIIIFLLFQAYFWVKFKSFEFSALELTTNLSLSISSGLHFLSINDDIMLLLPLQEY